MNILGRYVLHTGENPGKAAHPLSAQIKLTVNADDGFNDKWKKEKDGEGFEEEWLVTCRLPELAGV